jgi:hypothetical protein
LAAVTYLGPAPYFGIADSPFFDEVSSGMGVLEDFEDGALNVPGVVANCGGPIGARPSVDEDDGVIDGVGAGVSFVATAGVRCPNVFDFEFAPDFGGRYPTFIGFVVVGSVRMIDDEGNFSYQLNTSLFDVEGNEITDGRIIEFPEQFIGFDATTHRFVGFRSDVGIARLMTTGSRIDHLQFGIPEPQSALLVILGAALLLVRRRGRRRSTGVAAAGDGCPPGKTPSAMCYCRSDPAPSGGIGWPLASTRRVVRNW